MDIKCVTLAILCLIYISKIEIVGRDADFDGMAPKKRQCGSYKQYLGPEVEPWAEEPERSKRRRDVSLKCTNYFWWTLYIVTYAHLDSDQI